MYDEFEALKFRCEAEMALHDSANQNTRMLNYQGKDFAPVLDPTWNHPHRPAPKPRYKLNPAQLRRMQVV